MTNPADRQELASMLRGLRQDAEISTTRLAERLGQGWSQSRVSRIERGKSLPPPEDVEQWCRLLGADPETLRHLVEMARQLGVQLTEWRRELAPGRRRKQQELAQMESAASVIRLFSADVVPGLAQTVPYAKAMFQLGRDIEVHEDIEGVVEARLARQAVLDTEKRVELLMSEAAIHRRLPRLLASGDWHAQLERLLEVAGRPNVTVGVVPFDCTAVSEPHQYHAYAVLGDPDVDDRAVVLVETLTRALAIWDAGEIAAYIRHFAALAESAVTGDDLRAWLQELAARALPS